jgi:hypothetical protein
MCNRLPGVRIVEIDLVEVYYALRWIPFAIGLFAISHRVVST